MCQTSEEDSRVMIMKQLSKSPGPSLVVTRIRQRWGEGRRTRLSDCRPLGQALRATLVPVSAGGVVPDRLPFELSWRASLVIRRVPLWQGHGNLQSVTCQTTIQ